MTHDFVIAELDEGETRFIPLLNDKDSISDHFLGKVSYYVCVSTIPLRSSRIPINHPGESVHPN